MMALFFLLIFQIHAQEFPKNFLWCSATAAHQIEGNNDKSDWWQWEKLPGKIRNNDQSSQASNHWNMVSEDIQLMTDLGLDTYRFSLSWSKIEPLQGHFDFKALEHYQNEINELIKKGIKPIVTLHHFTQPQWFQDLGGWENKKAVNLFLSFVKIVYSILGKNVQYWTTINEPMVFIGGGYIEGVTPPGKNRADFGPPLIHLLQAHAEAYHYIKGQAKKENREVLIGLAHHLRPLEAWQKWNPIDLFIAYYADKVFNWDILQALKTGTLDIYVPFLINIHQDIPQLKNTQDYIGINYYTRELLHFSFSEFKILRELKPSAEFSDLNWEIYPAGFKQVISDTHRIFPNTPILITENGIADKKDVYRARYINTHLKVLLESIQKSIPILGYCHWTLMDNFEWIEGFEPRFGLYEVDYSNYKRKARESTKYFKQIIENNKLIPLTNQ